MHEGKKSEGGGTFKAPPPDRIGLRIPHNTGSGCNNVILFLNFPKR